jgi:ribulose-phosphate 3-epimerase
MPAAPDLFQGAPHLSVGVVSADLMRLAENLQTLAGCGCRLLHFDVMDGRFCPQITAGPFFVKGVKSALLKDVHLMVEDPLPLIPEFAAAGADIITVHAESGRHAHRALQLIGAQKNAHDPSRAIMRGIALNPGTPLAALEPLLDEADFFLLLAVNPGFPGQKFIAATTERLASLKAMFSKRGENVLLGIDGGITADTIRAAAAAGPHLVVTGSAVFEGGKITENFTALQNLLKKG